MTVSLLTELEQVELDSRARRLATEAEADRRLSAATAAAEEIAAAGEHQVEAALGTLRERYRELADAQIAAAEAELAQIDREAGQDQDAGPAFEAAVDAIVAAVLGEAEV
ncbi:MAG: hypothetical protein WEE50_11205 [Chloroflexota bacterium]